MRYMSNSAQWACFHCCAQQSVHNCWLCLCTYMSEVPHWEYLHCFSTVFRDFCFVWYVFLSTHLSEIIRARSSVGGWRSGIQNEQEIRNSKGIGWTDRHNILGGDRAELQSKGKEGIKDVDRFFPAIWGEYYRGYTTDTRHILQHQLMLIIQNTRYTLYTTDCTSWEGFNRIASPVHGAGGDRSGVGQEEGIMKSEPIMSCKAPLETHSQDKHGTVDGL